MSSPDRAVAPPAAEEIPKDWQVVHEVDPEYFRVYLVIRYLAFLGIGAHASFIALFAWLGVVPLAGFNFLSVAAWLKARRCNESGRRDAAIRWIIAEVVAHAVLATCLLGWRSGFQNYLIPLIPFTVFNQRLPVWVLRSVTSSFCLLYLALYKLAPSVAAGAPPVAVLDRLFFLNTLVIFTALGMISYYFRQASVTAERSMAKLANHDALTGLPNRRRLLQVLEIEVARSQREGTRFCLAIGDIDHFKTFNDQHGHDCGDAVLKTVGGLLRKGLRHDDTPGRWGGEEFLLIVRHPKPEEGVSVVERIRATIEAHPMTFENKALRVTMTFGVALFTPEGTLDDLIKRADEALYDGKRAGRNRVVEAPEPESRATALRPANGDRT